MQHSLPELFIERIRAIAPPDQLDDILESFSSPKLPSFRVNTLISTSEEVTTSLKHDGFRIEKIPWAADAFSFLDKSIRELTDTNVYKEGRIYIQSLSSMIPVLALDPKPGEKILDIAAAPGSKTTQIAACMHGTGELVANDLSRERIYKLKDNLKLQHATGVTITNVPGERLWQRYPEYFDRTLVDVPCSMEGRISLLDPKSYADWSTKRIKSLATRQQYLLRGALTATKIGGTIVYSTCTLSPEENEGVINWLIEKEGDKIEIEEVSIPGLTLASGLSEWKRPFDPRVTMTSRVWPSTTREGFFVAKIRKIASTLPLPSLTKSLKHRK